MKRVLFFLLMIFSAGMGACTTRSAPRQESTITPGISTPTRLQVAPAIKLPETDRILFTIPNVEPWSGREGEPRPHWLGWGTETFTIAPDGSFWIADTAVDPNRLLHYSAQGELLDEITLQNLVVYPYDLAITEESLWVLDISAQQPKIVQLNMDGGFQSSLNIPEDIMTDDGQFVSNGAFDLFSGDEGELLLASVSGYYEMIDASGKVITQPLDALDYYGHTYQTGIYSEVTGRVPIYRDGNVLETSPDFHVFGDLFLGFNADGSFAIAGQVESAEHQADFQVMYFGSSGELLGMARQRPQTFYKDFNHHLAFGPDGSIYQLLSNPDHSVQILRLGFSAELSAVVEMPVLTPTPLTVLLPIESVATDEEQARNALLTLFGNLSTGNYEEAAPHFGGEFDEYTRTREPGESMGAYWEYICTTVLWCLPISDITNTEQVSETEFVFNVVFMHPDGTRFIMGACCGGDPAATPPVWQFAYPVRKVDGVWKVMREPLFTP